MFTKLLKALVYSRLLAVVCSCSFSKTSPVPSSGVVLLVTKKYDTASKTYIRDKGFPEIKIWYSDGWVIQEITHVSIYNDGRKREITQKSDHYALMNLEAGKMYDFSSFSDTAKLLKNYPPYNDSMRVEGVNLFSRAKDSFTRTPVQLTDTVIDHHSYKRYRVYFLNRYQEPPGEQVAIAYGNCDKANTIFQFFKNRIDENCPITRIDYVPSGLMEIPFSIEYQFIADKLSQKELNVFTALENKVAPGNNR